MINEKMSFRDPKIDTFTIFTSLGFVFYGTKYFPQEDSSVWCTSVFSGDMSLQRPNFKSKCQRNDFLGKNHMIVFYKSDT